MQLGAGGAASNLSRGRFRMCGPGRMGTGTKVPSFHETRDCDIVSAMGRKSVTIEIDADLAAAARVVAEAQGHKIRDVYESALRGYLGGPVASTAREELLRLLDHVSKERAVTA